VKAETALFRLPDERYDFEENPLHEEYQLSESAGYL